VDRLKHIGWVIATGEHDHLIGENRWFARCSREGSQRARGVLGGQFGHDWPYWRDNLRRFVP
jgi:esterase/lipase superfamily enzyme